LNYIGPFIKSNQIKEDNILDQLFHLSKEAIKFIELYSHFGNTIDKYDLQSFNMSNQYPLLSIYKKADITLLIDEKSCYLDEKSFKKEYCATSNALLSLNLLELSDYYEEIYKDDPLKTISELYRALSKKQLEHYAHKLRNQEGFFVDMEEDLEKGSLTLKSNKYKLSDQALFMAAYNKCGNSKEGPTDFKAFSLEILDMLFNNLEDIYSSSELEIVKIILALNIVYKSSKSVAVEGLLLDLNDLIIEDIDSLNLETLSFLSIVTSFTYLNTGIYKLKDNLVKIQSQLTEYYDEDSHSIKKSGDKTVKYNCCEITFFQLSDLLSNKCIDTKSLLGYEYFQKNIIKSGIIKSWPESPNIESAERYSNYIKKSDFLLPESHFRMSTFGTPEQALKAPLFSKYIVYNPKKGTFKEGKDIFESEKNLLIFLVITMTKMLITEAAI